jgi:hypothetical protein
VLGLTQRLSLHGGTPLAQQGRELLLEGKGGLKGSAIPLAPPLSHYQINFSDN